MVRTFPNNFVYHVRCYHTSQWFHNKIKIEKRVLVKFSVYKDIDIIKRHEFQYIISVFIENISNNLLGGINFHYATQRFWK